MDRLRRTELFVAMSYDRFSRVGRRSNPVSTVCVLGCERSHSLCKERDGAHRKFYSPSRSPVYFGTNWHSDTPNLIARRLHSSELIGNVGVTSQVVILNTDAL